MGFAAELKAIASRGNVVDLAVGVIIGAAFGKIVDSVVNDLIMPVVGRLAGGLDLSSWFAALGEAPPGTPRTLDAMRKAAVPVFAYGSFLTVCLNFAILALVVFVMVRQLGRLRKAQPPPPPAPPEEVALLREIRDALRAR